MVVCQTNLFNSGVGAMLKGIGSSLLAVAFAGISTVAMAQEKSSKSSRSSTAKVTKTDETTSEGSRPTATGKRFSGRLPRYFASLVDQEQRDEIYQIRATYREQLAALEQELADLKEAEMSAMEKVLTTTQRKKLDEMRASAEKSAKAKSASTSSSAKTLAAKSSAKE